MARAYPGGSDKLKVFEATGLIALHGFKALEQLRKVRLSLDEPRNNAQKELTAKRNNQRSE